MGNGRASGANGEYKYQGKIYHYGEEYHTVLQYGNIKYIKRNQGAISAPRETSVDPKRKPDGRIYVSVSGDDKVRYISFYDKNGAKYRTLDVGNHHHYNNDKTIDYTINHAHIGYNHNEKGNGFLTKEERHLAAGILLRWRNYKKSLLR